MSSELQLQYSTEHHTTVTFVFAKVNRKNADDRQSTESTTKELKKQQKNKTNSLDMQSSYPRQLICPPMGSDIQLEFEGNVLFILKSGDVCKKRDSI